MSNIKTQTGKVIGRSLNAYHSRVKPKIDELKFKESYQGKIIDCMVGEVDDNYIETPETDAPIVKLEHSKEGLVKIPTIKGKTILVDADGNETDTPAEGCKLVSVGEAEGNKMIILSKNSDSSLHHKTEILLDEPLRKLPNGVCNEIVGNKLIKRVGEVTFNGSENWSKYGVGENDDFITFVFSLTCTNKHLKSKQMWAQQQRNRGRSNCLPSIGDKVYFNTIDTEGFCQGHNDTATTNSWCIAISKSKLTTIDINGFKKWLSENPVTIIYELVEPIIEELPNGITLQGFDDTTMYIENSITPIVQYGYNALIPYKEELSNQKEEVETNTLDIEQNIIPYLMDMEFNLMLMEDNE